VFEQAGIIEVDSIAEMIDAVEVLAFMRIRVTARIPRVGCRS
jgi:acyl-CoA synthetase (NDP forming)